MIADVFQINGGGDDNEDDDNYDNEFSLLLIFRMKCTFL